MVQLVKKLLEHIGIDPERLRLEWVSAAEGVRFAEVMNDFDAKLKKLGPLGTSEGKEEKELKSKIEEVTNLIPYIKQAKREKLSARLDKEEDYGTLYTSEEVDSLFRDVVSYYIDPELCKACLICLRQCPEEGIIGGKNQIHVIDQDKCIRCGNCFEVCPPRFGAVKKIIGEPVPPPIPEEERTIVRKSKKAS
jgi:Fe-S-cluster-containing hydrogenase component 2